MSKIIRVQGGAPGEIRYFNVRFTDAGDRCGPEDADISYKARIDIFDSTFEGKPGFHQLGQFVSAYHAETLTRHPRSVGLDMQGGEPHWKLPPKSSDAVSEFASEMLARKIEHQEDPLTVAIDHLALALGNPKVLVASGGTSWNTGILNLAIEQLVNQTRALDETKKIAALANEHGWNGVENSKVLSTFLASILEERVQLRGALAESQARLTEYTAAHDLHEHPSSSERVQAQQTLDASSLLLDRVTVEPSLEEKVNSKLAGLGEALFGIGEDLQRRSAAKPR